MQSSLLVLMGVWCLIVALALIASDSLLRGLLLSATASAIFLPLITRSACNRLDILEPIVPASIALLVMFVARPIADQLTFNYVHLGYNFSDTFDTTLITVLIGCVAFAWGYLSNVGAFVQRLLSRPTLRFPAPRVLFVGGVIALLGLALFTSFLSSQGGIRALSVIVAGRSKLKFDMERSSTGYLYYAIYFCVPSTLMFTAAWLRFRHVYFLALSLSIGTPVLLYQMAQGDRSQMLPILLGVPTIYYLYKGRRPKMRNVLLMATVAIALFAAIRESRTAGTSGQTEFIATFSDQAAENIVATFTKDDDEMFDTLANVLSVVPSRIPFHPLGALTDIATRLLPRAIYRNKPLETGDQVITELWPKHYAYSRASAASSIFGALYLYGGPFAVAIGAFGIGMMFGQIWKWLLLHQRNVNAMLLYACVPSFVVILLRGTITDTLSRMFFTVLPLVVAQHVWKKAS